MERPTGAPGRSPAAGGARGPRAGAGAGDGGGGGFGGGRTPLKLYRFRASAHKSVDACLHPCLPWVALCDQGDEVVLWDYERKETLYHLQVSGRGCGRTRAPRRPSKAGWGGRGKRGVWEAL